METKFDKRVDESTDEMDYCRLFVTLVSAQLIKMNI